MRTTSLNVCVFLIWENRFSFWISDDEPSLGASYTVICANKFVKRIVERYCYAGRIFTWLFFFFLIMNDVMSNAGKRRSLQKKMQKWKLKNANLRKEMRNTLVLMLRYAYIAPESTQITMWRNKMRGNNERCDIYISIECEHFSQFYRDIAYGWF